MYLFYCVIIVLKQLINFITVTFYAYDQVRTLDDNDLVIDHPIATADYLALLRHPGIPNHELQLKEGAICILM